ncbi:uroporphyrinogen-III C-methyltransferase [Fictibacillus phosphorivorans]|uniref:uroporphyrinogen-III C-methyltransferase n=1 Tax=Fictibacillus phosphorivorans TaxID=1221500 RepID=UPI00203D339C|nr:uroporphyrinogen-III C-methyltransferase [Fictibacillus phosphorivorans]MCM3718809.1 uroporphyrinogen-III C-methyltransferase [Fictibacillus phosphorivorans]MCM3776432.1 uroporphyrinogen-III C-methyltransferase [Fictibacillus phosphorivorans]
MGKAYLVGAGPGDPDLITRKGLKCIQEADVILFDRLINQELLSYAKNGADLIYCGKKPGKHSMDQDMINQYLVRQTKRGRIVTRLKGGDPFVYGRGGEEAQVLAKHGIPYEIVPGITSGMAAPMYAGIPVTHRDYSSTFAIVTGHMRQGKDHLCWESIAKGIDTLVIYMGVGNLPYIQQQLLKHGRSKNTPVAIVHSGTTVKQHTVTGTLLSIVEIAEKNQIQNPGIIIIGEVVRLREKIQWFEQVNRQQTALDALTI